MTSYTGTLVSSTDRSHPSTSSLVAAGALALGLVCLVALSAILPDPPQATMALPPVQATAALSGDASVPDAATVFSGRDIGLEESAPSI